MATAPNLPDLERQAPDGVAAVEGNALTGTQ